MTLFRVINYTGRGEPDLPPMEGQDGGPQLHYEVDGITHGSYAARFDVGEGVFEVDTSPETLAYMQAHPERWEKI